MNEKQHHSVRDADAGDRFARRIAVRLSAGSQTLPHDISERLRVARQQAVAQRRMPVLQPTVALQPQGHGAATLGGGDGAGWWTRLASAVPLVALVAGLVAISMVQSEQRAHDLAEVDAQLLVDDLPPAAYADPGFTQFLRTDTAAGER